MYVIRFSADAERPLHTFSARDQRVLLSEIEDQLSYEPTEPTRNRKQLRPNVDEAIVTVFIVGVARKQGNQLVVEGKEYRP